jgi:hypothetical protein
MKPVGLRVRGPGEGDACVHPRSTCLMAPGPLGFGESRTEPCEQPGPWHGPSLGCVVGSLVGLGLGVGGSLGDQC